MELATTTMRIYRNKARDATSLLMPDRTLKQCGFIGGTRSEPGEYVLYYDYSTEFHDCSILMSDYYFAS